MNVWGLTKKYLGIGMLVLPLTMSATLTGCLTEDDPDDPPPTSTPLAAEKNVTLGAQGATLGSVMDIDAATETAMVLNSSAANAAQESIDLVFLFYSGSFYLHNAVGARTAGRAQTPPINLVDSYDVNRIKDIKMVKVNTKPKDQEAAKAALDAGSATQGSVITGGEMFVVQSTGGKIALVTVGTIAGTNNQANATFTVSINTI